MNVRNWVQRGAAACAALLWLAACAGAPGVQPEPPSQGTVAVPQYGIRLTPPSGWSQDAEPPAWITRSLPLSQSRSVIASFSNKRTTGFILVSASRFEDRADAAVLLSEIREELMENSRRQAKRADRDPRRSYAFRLFDIEPSDAPQPVLREILVTESETLRFVIHGTRFFYRCGGPRSCGLDVVLISDAKTFDHNFEIYNGFVEGIEPLPDA